MIINRYRIVAQGFTSIEVCATSLKAALEKVHPNVRKAFDYAQVSSSTHTAPWEWCTESV